MQSFEVQRRSIKWCEVWGRKKREFLQTERIFFMDLLKFKFVTESFAKDSRKECERENGQQNFQKKKKNNNI